MYLTTVKTAVKDLVKPENSSIISITGLAIAFVTVFIIYSRVAFELGYDSHHENADRIYRVSGEIITAGSEARHAVVGPYMGRGLKEHFPAVEEFARLAPIQSTIILERDGAEFSIEEAYYVDPTVFSLFTIDFLHGDMNSALAGPNQIVINQSLSNQMFGGENPVGRTLMEGNNLLTVVGVIKDSPNNSHHKLNVLFSHPNPDFYPEDEPAVRMSEGYWMPSAYHFILLAPGTGVEEITGNFDSFYDRYMSQFGEVINATFNPLVIPLREVHYSQHMSYDYPKGNRMYSWFLILIAIFVLVIAGINYSNLLIARNITRSKSMGVRKIIGATNRDLYIQSLTGSLAYILLAQIIAFLLFLGTLTLIAPLTGLDVAEYPFGEIVFLSLVILIVTGLLTSLIPWLNQTGKSALDMIRPWKYMPGKGTIGFGRLSTILQYTMTIVLILSAIIMSRQMRYLVNGDMGFDKEGILLVKLSDTSNEPHHISSFREELLNNSEIEAASFSTNVPGEVLGTTHFGVSQDGEMATRIVKVMGVGYDYIPLMGMELLSGRNFDPLFNDSYFNSAIVNEAFIDFCGLTGDITGLQIDQSTVIGVVKNVSLNSLHNTADPVMFYHTLGSQGYMNIKFRTADPGAAILAVQNAWEDIFTNSRIDIQFLDNRVDMMYSEDQRTNGLIKGFAVVSIFLSLMGLVNLTTIIMKRRTKEIGIRKVNGAKVWEVMAMLNINFIKWVALAFIVALPVAWYAMNRWLQNFAYRTELSWWIFALAGVIALGIALLTVSWQSWRAASRNPVEALRYE